MWIQGVYSGLYVYIIQQMWGSKSLKWGFNNNNVGLSNSNGNSNKRNEDRTKNNLGFKDHLEFEPWK
jgi:hypothetical protein